MQVVNETIEKLKGRVILLHGFFKDNFFEQLIGRSEEFFVLEGRPTLRSGQHTCAKLLHFRIIPTVISDNMAGFLFFQNCVKEVWVSSHGEEAGQVKVLTGGLILQILAKQHQIPFFMVAGDRDLHNLATDKDLRMFNHSVVTNVDVKILVPTADLIKEK